MTDYLCINVSGRGWLIRRDAIKFIAGKWMVSKGSWVWERSLTGTYKYPAIGPCVIVDEHDEVVVVPGSSGFEWHTNQYTRELDPLKFDELPRITLRDVQMILAME